MKTINKILCLKSAMGGDGHTKVGRQVTHQNAKPKALQNNRGEHSPHARALSCSTRTGENKILKYSRIGEAWGE